jgi:hypothetical protein
MRRILIEQARRKCSQRRGGARRRCDLLDDDRLDTSRIAAVFRESDLNLIAGQYGRVVRSVAAR